MAYVSPDEDEEQQQQGGAQQQGAERVLTPESGTVNAGPSSGAQASGAASQGQKKASGTGWTNLQRYVEANQGADERMGGQIRGSLDKTAGGVTEQQNTYKDDVASNVAANRFDDDGTIASLKSNPTKVNRERYKNQTGAYQGYQQADQAKGFREAEKGVQGLQKQAGDLNDFSKRQSALADIYGKGQDGSPVRYTGGEQRLDTFLIGAGEGGQKALSDINTQYGQGGNYAKGWEGLVQKVQGDIDAGRQAHDATAAATRAARDAAVQGYDDKFSGYRGQLSQEAHDAEAATNDFLGRLYSLTPEVRAAALQEFGIDPTQASLVTPDQLDDFVSQHGARSLGDLVSDDEAASYQALLDLEGQSADPSMFTKSGNSFGLYDLNRGGAQQVVSDAVARDEARKQAERDAYVQDQLAIRHAQEEQRRRDEAEAAAAAEAAASSQQGGDGVTFGDVIDAHVPLPGAPKKASGYLSDGKKKLRIRR